MQKFHSFSAYSALMFTVLCWGLSFVAIKIALESFSAFSLIFIRFSIAALVFLGIMFFRGFPSFTRKEYLQIFCASLFQPGLYFLFETTGLQHSGASKASLIIAAIPIVILCLAVIFLKERLQISTLIGTAISLLGISLLIVNSQEGLSGANSPILGDLLILVNVKHPVGPDRALVGIAGMQLSGIHKRNFTGPDLFYPVLIEKVTCALLHDSNRIISVSMFFENTALVARESDFNLFQARISHKFDAAAVLLFLWHKN